MHYNTQNLKKEDNEKRLFHFRGWFYNNHFKLLLRYEFASGPSCSFSFGVDTYEYGSFSFIFGFLFFTLYLTTIRPKWWRWGSGRKYGFYWMNKECRFFWNEKPLSSYDGWYWYFRPLDILFGKSIFYEKDKMYENYKPIHFKFRGKEYQLDEIHLKDWFVFRTRVPFSLWHRKGTYMHIRIDKPPMYAGKGTTAHNIDDDGIYCLSCKYDGPEIGSWDDREKLYRYAVKKYCNEVHRGILRYGRAADDKEDKNDCTIEYTGIKKNINSGECGSDTCK